MIVGLLMCRNEADILDMVLTHNRAQGIDEILAIDNGSTDGTVEILENHGAVVMHDPELAYNQEARMGMLANSSRALSADWLVPFDADECWSGTNGRTLAEVMSTTTADILAADCYRVWPGDLREPNPQPWPCVAFRPMSGARLAKGNHNVSRPGRCDHGELIIHEYQYRDFSQMRLKVTRGAVALDAAGWPPNEGAHWRRYAAMSDEELWNEWVALSTNPDLIPI